MCSSSIVVAPKQSSWEFITEITDTLIVKLDNIKILLWSWGYFQFISPVMWCVSLHFSKRYSVFGDQHYNKSAVLFFPNQFNALKKHQKALLSHIPPLIPPVAAQTKRHTHLHVASISPPESLDAKHARKMTSMLSILPREVSPTHGDVAITYHHQKVLVWW